MPADRKLHDSDGAAVDCHVTSESLSAAGGGHVGDRMGSVEVDGVHASDGRRSRVDRVSKRERRECEPYALDDVLRARSPLERLEKPLDEPLGRTPDSNQRSGGRAAARRIPQKRPLATISGGTSGHRPTVSRSASAGAPFPITSPADHERIGNFALSRPPDGSPSANAAVDSGRAGHARGPG